MSLPTERTWSPATPLRVEHPQRALLAGARALLLYAPTPPDKERWYLALSLAAGDGAMRAGVERVLDDYAAYMGHVRAQWRLLAGATDGAATPLNDAMFLNPLLARAFFDLVEETLNTKRQLEHVAKRDDPKNYAAKFATFEHTARQQDLHGKNPLAMTLDDVFAAAEAAYDTFHGEMKMLAGSANAELVMAPLKTRERAEAKVRGQYDGMNCRINDVVRCSIVCDSEIELVIAGIGFASLVSTCAVSILSLIHI